MANTDEVDRMRREYESSLNAAAKAWYTNGADPEKRVGWHYKKWADAHNSIPGNRFVMVPRKRRRQ